MTSTHLMLLQVSRLNLAGWMEFSLVPRTVRCRDGLCGHRPMSDGTGCDVNVRTKRAKQIGGRSDRPNETFVRPRIPHTARDRSSQFRDASHNSRLLANRSWSKTRAAGEVSLQSSIAIDDAPNPQMAPRIMQRHETAVCLARLPEPDRTGNDAGRREARG